MLRLVGQQRLRGRERGGRRPFLPLPFLPRDSESIVQRALPRALCDAAQSLDATGRHRLAALVAARNEREVVVERRKLRLKAGRERRFVAAGRARLPIRDLRVALQHFEAGADFVNAVAQGLELGRLVDDVLGRGHLAAIVQPACDVHRLPFVLAQREVAEGSVARIARGAREHFREHRHALAMPAGVGRFGVDRGGHELDERFEERLLRGDQAAGLDRDRRHARKLLDKRDDLRLDVLRAHGPVEQRQHTFDLSRPIAQRNGEQPDVTAAEALRLGPEPFAACAIGTLDVLEHGPHFERRARKRLRRLRGFVDGDGR